MVLDVAKSLSILTIVKKKLQCCKNIFIVVLM